MDKFTFDVSVVVDILTVNRNITVILFWDTL